MVTHRNFASGFRFYFNLIMSALYVMAGIIVIFAWRPDYLPLFNRRVIGTVLILYGLYRGWKIFRENTGKIEQSNES